MRHFHFWWLAILLIIVTEMSAIADAGDQAGWSVRTDPRGRAFLMWVPQEDGPRTLMLGCLRDADTFTTMSYAVGASDEINPVKLTLTNAKRVSRLKAASRYTQLLESRASLAISKSTRNNSGAGAEVAACPRRSWQHRHLYGARWASGRAQNRANFEFWARFRSWIFSQSLFQVNPIARGCAAPKSLRSKLSA